MRTSEQQLKALLKLVHKDLHVLRQFIERDLCIAWGASKNASDGILRIYEALKNAAEDLGDIAYFVGPKGDDLAAKIAKQHSRPDYTALSLARAHAKTMREQLDLVSAAGMKPFLQFQRLRDSVCTLPEFIDDMEQPKSDVLR